MRSRMSKAAARAGETDGDDESLAVDFTLASMTEAPVAVQKFAASTRRVARRIEYDSPE